ncbi:MAG: UbiA family prenyltransferase [candidate division Zixibacteria bacterium]|nr:UbiA family prenyltransferase [candidate division Zixibacteria bacterium]
MKILDFLFFGRPLLLIPVWTVYIHCHAKLHHTPRFNTDINPFEIVDLVALSLIFMGTYVVNQIFDIESDRLNNKLFFLPRQIISVKTAWIYYVLLSIAGIAIAGMFSVPGAFIIISLIILGLLYSIPIVRLKDRPVSGLLANAVAYGFLVPMMTGIIDVWGYSGIIAIPYFLAIAAGYILTTIPDRDGDAASGKKTVAVILGETSAIWLALLVTIAAGAASFLSDNIDMLFVSAITVGCLLALLFGRSKRLVLFSCKFPILLMTTFAASYLPVYLIFLLLTIALTKFYYKKRFDFNYPELS